LPLVGAVRWSARSAGRRGPLGGAVALAPGRQDDRSGATVETVDMTWDELLQHCLAKPGAWQDEPWEGDVVVKVGSKIFAFLGAETGASVGVKCGRTRDEADEWLHRYPDDATVMAYIGRSGWNTLRLRGAIPDEELLEAVDASYDTVVAKLPRKERPAP
jgi:predicted DNA-binding protein (MmcQ/YjbR family)